MQHAPRRQSAAVVIVALILIALLGGGMATILALAHRTVLAVLALVATVGVVIIGTDDE
jgi:hypothetical protein